jgi:hypothetical protein
MPLDESGDFDPEPRTQSDYIRAIWQKLRDHDDLIRVKVIGRLDTINGRVGSLEKWKFAVGGGLAVVTAVLVPIFIFLVLHQTPVK